MRRALLCLALLSPAAADEVTLKDGRVLEGDVVQDDGKVLKLKMRSGTLTFNRADVASVVEKPTPEQEYEQRRAKLPDKDAAARLELGRWCATKKLEDEAVQLFLEAWKLDSALEGASAELKKRDWHLVDGAWQDPDTYYPSIGWLKLDTTWYHPREHAWRSAEREVAKLQAARNESKTAHGNATASVKRLTGEVTAEQAKADGYPPKIKEAEEAWTVHSMKHGEAKAKTVSAAAAVKAGEETFENSREGEGGNLTALNELKRLRKELAAARAAENRAEKAVKDQEKKIASLKSAKADSDARLAKLQADLNQASYRVNDLDAKAHQEEEAIAKARGQAEEMKRLWEAEKGKK